MFDAADKYFFELRKLGVSLWAAERKRSVCNTRQRVGLIQRPGLLPSTYIGFSSRLQRRLEEFRDKKDCELTTTHKRKKTNLKSLSSEVASMMKA